MLPDPDTPAPDSSVEWDSASRWQQWQWARGTKTQSDSLSIATGVCASFSSAGDPLLFPGVSVSRVDKAEIQDKSSYWYLKLWETKSQIMHMDWCEKSFGAPCNVFVWSRKQNACWGEQVFVFCCEAAWCAHVKTRLRPGGRTMTSVFSFLCLAPQYR